MATLRRSRSACVGPVKFWKPGTIPAGIPVSRIATRSARSCSSRCAARFGNTPGYRSGSSVPSSGLLTYWAKSASWSGWRAVPLVLAGDRNDHLVEQRVAEARHLHERAGHWCLAVVAEGWPCGGAPTPRRRSSRSSPAGRSARCRQRVRRLIGTWIAIVWTLNERSALTPARPASGSGAGSGTGAARRGRRSSRGRRRSRRAADRRTP